MSDCLPNWLRAGDKPQTQEEQIAILRSVLAGKPVALLGVAGGRIGAIKSLEQLRGICSHAGAIVLPGSVSVAGVRGAFDKEGNCVDAGVEKMLRGLAGSLLDFLKDYVCPKYNLEAVVRGETTPWSATL